MNRFKILIILILLSSFNFGCGFNAIDRNSKLDLRMPDNGTIRTAGGLDINKPTSYVVKITSQDGKFFYEEVHSAGAEVRVDGLFPDLYFVEVMGKSDSYVFTGSCKVEVTAGSIVDANIQLQASYKIIPVTFSLDSSVFDTLKLENFYYTITNETGDVYENLENIKIDSLSKDNPTFDITTIKGGHKYNIALYGENDKFAYKFEKNNVYLSEGSLTCPIDSSSMTKVSSYIQLETDYTLSSNIVTNPLTVTLRGSGSNVVASKNITQLPYIINHLKADTYTIDISSSSTIESYVVNDAKVVSFDDVYDSVASIIPKSKSLYFVKAGASTAGATGIESAPFATLTTAVNQAESVNNENSYTVKIEGNVTGEQPITTSTGKSLNLIRKTPSSPASIKASSSLFNINGGTVVTDGINLSGNSSTAIVNINNSGTFKIKGDCTVTNSNGSGNSVVVTNGLLQLENCKALDKPVYLKGTNSKISVLSSLTPSTVATIKLDNYDRTEPVLMGSSLSTLKTKFKMADNNYEINDSGKSVRKLENVTFNIKNFSSYQGTNQLTYTISEGSVAVSGHKNQPVPDNGSIVVNGLLKAGIEYTVTVTGSKGDYNFQADTAGNKFTIKPDKQNSFELPIKPITGSLNINSSSVTLSGNTFTVEISGGGLSSARTETVTSFPHLVKDLPCDPKTTFNITVKGTTAEETYSSPSTAEVTAGKSVNYNVDATPAPGFYYVDAKSGNRTAVGTKAAPLKRLDSAVNLINGLADSSPQYTIIIINNNGDNGFSISNSKKIEITHPGPDLLGATLTITIDPGAHLTLNKIQCWRNGNGNAHVVANGTLTIIDAQIINADVDIGADQKLRLKGSAIINQKTHLASGATIEIIGDLTQSEACVIDVADKPGVGVHGLILTGSGSLVKNNYTKIGLSSELSGYTIDADGYISQK